MHASPIFRDLFLELIYTLPVIRLHCFQNLSRVFPVLAVANVGSCVGMYNKIDHPARHSR